MRWYRGRLNRFGVGILKVSLVVNLVLIPLIWLTVSRIGERNYWQGRHQREIGQPISSLNLPVGRYFVQVLGRVEHYNRVIAIRDVFWPHTRSKIPTECFRRIYSLDDRRILVVKTHNWRKNIYLNTFKLEELPNGVKIREVSGEYIGFVKDEFFNPTRFGYEHRDAILIIFKDPKTNKKQQLTFLFVEVDR